jgi:hypothetical protein
VAINQIFNLKNTSLAQWRTGDQDNKYPQWLRDNGIWIKDNAWKFDVTGTVYFPADGYYNFKFTADNYARFSIDGYDLPESNDFTKMFSEIVWVTAGNHTIRCRASDKGNTARSCAMIIDDDTQLVRVWNLMTNGTTNWQNNPVNIVRQPTQSNYCKLLNDFGVWPSTGETFDNTWMIDFPVDAYYNFRGAIDNLGQAWVDGQPLADINGQTKEYNSTKFITAGRKALRVTGRNTGGPKAAAFVVEGSIKDLVAAKASANSAVATTDQALQEMNAAKAKMDQARWKQIPMNSVSIRTSNTGGYKSASANSLVMNLDVLNYTSGTTWTDSNNRFNATLTQPPVYTSGQGSHFSFNGTSQRGNIGMPVTNDMTWIIWFNTTSTAGNPNAPWYQAPLMVGGEIGGDVADMGIGIAQGRIMFGMGQPDTTFVSTKSYNDGKWHQLAVTRNIANGQAQIFVDGALDNTHNNFPKGARINGGLGIGANTDGNTKFQGKLAQIRAYSSVLTLSQIRALYSVHGSRFLPVAEKAKDPTDNKQVVAYNNGGGVTVSKSESVSGGGFTASYEVSTYATYNQSASAEVTKTGASVYVGQSYSVGAEATAEAGNEYVGCQMRAWVDLTVTEEAYAAAGLNGNNAYVTAGACCIVRAETGLAAEGYVSNPYGPDVEMGAEGCVFAESGAKAEILIEIGQNGVQCEGGVAIGSCVGVEGSVTVEAGGVGANAGAGVTYGSDHFELEGGYQSTFKDGKLTMGVSGSVAAYVGLEDVNVSTSVDTKEIIKTGLESYRAHKYVYENRKQIYNTAVSASNQATAYVSNLAQTTANNTAKTFTDAGYQIENGIVKTGGKIADSCTDAAGKAFKAISGGGKIVCTMMNDEYGFGSYRNAIWLRYGANMPEADVYQRGYHTLFLPLVAYAKGTGRTNHWVKTALEHIARHRTSDIYLEMKGKRRDTLGRVYRAVLEPLCYITGKITK